MKLFDRGAEEAAAVTERANAWLAHRQDDRGLVYVGTELYHRDRDAFGSVLGSAIALRLFLFVIPANVMMLGLLNVFRLQSLLSSALEASPTTGTMASSYTDLSFARAVVVTISGAVLTVWAGRSLARVLATCSTASWQLPPREARVGLRAVVSLSALVIGLVLASAVFSWMRRADLLPISLVAWVIVAGSMSLCWFLVQMGLPRATTDPGAVLPGAILLGAGGALLQWVMQIYLPGKIERTTDTLGTLASTVAVLGYFFFIGRLMAATFVVNAVAYERWGSVSGFVFGLPGVRRIPARSAWVGRYFDLDRPAESDVDDAQPQP